jgi:hypothetical protein
MIKKKGKGFPAILQPFNMGDEPAAFDSKGEALGCAFMPSCKDLFFGQTVKRDIQFDGVEMFGIEFKPLSLGEIRGIKDPVPPMGIIIAAGTNEDHKSRG